MKILLAVIPVILCCLGLKGQSGVMTHLFKDKRKDLSLFINPTFQISEIVQQNCGIPGIRAGVIINKKFIIAGVYNRLFSDISLPESNGSGKLGMQWAGVHLEYTLWPLQKIHLTIPLSAGVGQLQIRESASGISTGNPNFIFAEPGLMIEANIWKYAKLGFGCSYRYTGNVSYNSLTSEDLTGFAIVGSVKFGMFNYPELKKNKRDPIASDIKVKPPHIKKRKR